MRTVSWLMLLCSFLLVLPVFLSCYCTQQSQDWPCVIHCLLFFSMYCFHLKFWQLHISLESPFFLNSCILHNSVLPFANDGVGRRVWFNNPVPAASKLFMTFYGILIRLPLCLSPVLLWTLSKVVTLSPFFQQHNSISLSKYACICLVVFFFHTLRIISSCPGSNYFIYTVSLFL